MNFRLRQNTLSPGSKLSVLIDIINIVWDTRSHSAYVQQTAIFDIESELLSLWEYWTHVSDAYRSYEKQFVSLP